MTKLVNLTPHNVDIFASDGSIITVPSSGIARCAQKTLPVGELVVDFDLDGQDISILLTSTEFGDVTGLPDPAPGTLYIVSRLVMAACPERRDLLVPNDLVRDEAGQITACRSLANS